MGLFVGVGIGAYDQGRHRALPAAVDDVEAVGRLLGDGFAAAVCTDPDEATARRRLQQLEGSLLDGGELVLLWSGHGMASPSGLRLLARDSGRSPAAGIAVSDVAGYCAVSGAGQILLILDTCYSGTALSATAVVAEVVQQLPPDVAHTWVGVLSSCRDVETAQDGLFGVRLRSLLQDGPTDPMLRLRWSVHNALLRADDLCDALVKEWGSARQSPQFQSRGDAWWMFRNPLYDPGAPEQVVEHLLLAARGGGPFDDRSWFTGRTVEVDAVVTRLRDGGPGLYVVTGSAGTGKSAIVGRVVSLANPAERRRLMSDGQPLHHADPGERVVHAHVHARGLTADGTAELIAGQLVRRRVLVAQEARRNAAELVGQVQRAVEIGAAPPVIVIDGLDEARGASFAIAEELLLRLSQYALVVVATRDAPRDGDGCGLVETLAPAGADLDLDTADARARTGRDLVRYVESRLAGVSPAMDPSLVAGRLAAGSFLLARLVTDRLRGAPIDTTADRWQDLVAGSIEEAFDADLAGAGQAGRVLLTALTRGYGAGLPEDEWLAVAGDAVTRADVARVLDRLGRYVVQDGEAGVAVYRLAHQSLADHLRPAFRPDHGTPFDPQALPLAAVLTERYRSLLANGIAAQAAGYLWRYVWRHAADAGPAGTELLRELARHDPALTHDIALAGAEVAVRLRHWGRWMEAVLPAEEAVAIYRDLAAADASYRPELGHALNILGGALGEIGRRAASLAAFEESVAVYREVTATSPQFVPDLAGALTNAAVACVEVGRHRDAGPYAEEAVTMYRSLCDTDPSLQDMLATALSNLGLFYTRVGRRDDALLLDEEAVALRRAQVEVEPSLLPELAAALMNVAGSYQDVGRDVEAVAPVEEAVAVYRDAATGNPRFLPDLARALRNLGGHYHDVGRRIDAVPPAEEAVAIGRELVAVNPRYLPDLAMALSGLAMRYCDVGRGVEALAPAQEAVDRYRALVGDGPAFRGELVRALANLGLCLGDVGRAPEAVAPAEEAVTLVRTLGTTDDAFRPDLAWALNCLSTWYGETGRHVDAVEPAEEAVAIYRELAATGPAFLPRLADALHNLGIVYDRVDRSADGVAPLEQAVALRRAQAEENPAALPRLATALDSLGNRYGSTGRLSEALAATEEAVARCRQLVTTNPAFMPDLASALNNLGIRYAQLGRWADAAGPAAEVVALRRSRAAANAAFRPELATALNNAGVHYTGAARHAEALAATAEAVALRRDLVCADPGDLQLLPDLADSLGDLDRRCAVLGESATAQQAWTDTLAQVDPADAAYLLVRRVNNAEQPEPAAVGWLVDALRRVAADDPELLAAVHRAARRQWAADPDRFEAVWAASVGPLPAWLTVDPALVAIAEAWMDTPTFTEERDHLAAHPEMLAPGADVAVAEALLDRDEAEAHRYQGLRDAARAEGVEPAYRRLVSGELARTFVDADPTGHAALLAGRRDELLTADVSDAIAELLDGAEPDAANRALGLLTLARTGDDGPVVDALLDPDRFPDLLRAFAVQAAGEALIAASVVAWTVADTPAAKATAEFYHAVGTAADDPDKAAALLAQARRRAPDRTAGWIGQLAAIGQQRPAVLPLIAPLTVPLDEPSGAGP